MRDTVLLSLICLATALCTLHCPAEAKKEKPSFKPFSEAVVDHFRCDVCDTMVREAFAMVADIRNNASRKTPLREEDILAEVVELICNPFANQGQWLRTLDLVVTAAPGSSSTSGGYLKLQPRSDFTKCKRGCTTLAAACERVIDSDDADNLSSFLFKGRPANADKLSKKICGNVCGSTSDAKKRASKVFPAKLTAEILRDQPEMISAKEMEIEALMDNLERSHTVGTPGMDVYSRDEMLQMQDAIQDGDLDTLAGLDPSAQDLSTEEFEMLRQMYRGEAAGLDDAGEPSADQQSEESSADVGAQPSVWDRLRSFFPW
jgi:hypothetical protein